MRKVLFDSSCSYAVLAPEIEPGVNSQFPSQSDECKYYTGVYLRMEFMRRWVMTGIELYMTARNLEDLNVAVEYFGNSFSAREVKAVLKWVNRFNKVTQCESVSEPIERFGWEVYNFALAYDIVFKHFVQQKTSCKRGIVEFDLGTTTRRKALSEFYERFAETDFACNLDELLNLRV